MSLSEILTQCRSENNQMRREAETRIDMFSMSDFGKLLEDCAQELANESNPKENRQLCATLIKNMILNQPKHQGKWEQLNPDIKFRIKSSVISCLASKIKEVRKATAITVAGICKLEIPRGEWPDIIKILIQTSANSDMNIRMSSIITIGYISQELVPGNLAVEEVDGILSSLINNLSPESDLEIVSLAIVSFLNFILFARKNFETPHEKDVIFSTIFSCLSHHNVDVRVYAMQCLVEVSRLYYDHLDTHIETIINCTDHHMKNDEEKVAIQAYEFWCSISDEEVNRLKSNQNIQGYCEKAIQKLYSTIQGHLLNRNIETERLNEDAWTNVKAGSCLLSNLSQCTGPALIDEVFNLIRDNIHSEQPKNRDSSLLAYGSVLNTSHLSKIKEIIPNSIPSLLGMLNDKSWEVRVTASWCLKKITELHSDCLAQIDIFDNFITAIINHLNANKRVVIQLCDCIHFLAMNFMPDFTAGESSGFMSKYMHDLLNKLLALAFTKDAYDPNHNVALAAFFSMGSLIDYAPSDTYALINIFFSDIYNAFATTLDKKCFDKDETRFAYQSYIATVISACAVGGKINLNLNEAYSMYTLIKNSFIQRVMVYEEGLMACSSLILALGGQSDQIVKDFLEYINYGLCQWQDSSICRISINSASDLLRAMGGMMNEYIGQIIPKILEILQNPNSDKYLKTQSFIVVTDMFVYTREEALKNYDQIMIIIIKALEAATYVNDKNDDSDLIEYFKSLRDHLVECITCILHCLKDSERVELFDNHVMLIINFINNIVEEKYEPSLETLAGVLGIIGDLCEIYQSRMKEILNQNIIAYLIEKMKTSRIPKYVKLAEWSTYVINTILIS